MSLIDFASKRRPNALLHHLYIRRISWRNIHCIIRIRFRIRVRGVAFLFWSLTPAVTAVANFTPFVSSVGGLRVLLRFPMVLVAFRMVVIVVVIVVVVFVISLVKMMIARGIADGSTQTLFVMSFLRPTEGRARRVSIIVDFVAGSPRACGAADISVSTLKGEFERCRTNARLDEGLLVLILVLPPDMRLEIIEPWPPFPRRPVTRLRTRSADIPDLVAYAW